MIGLIFNELEKNIKKKRIIAVILMLGASLLFLSLVSIKNISDSKPEIALINVQRNIENMKRILDNQNISSSKRREISLNLKSSEERKAYLESQISNDSIDWKDKINNDIQRLEKQKQELGADLDKDKLEDILTQIKINSYNLNRNNEPDNTFDITAIAIILRVMVYLNMLFLPIILIILSADVISGENSPNTLKMMLTKPVSRGGIVSSKFISTILISVIMIILSEIIAFLLIGIFFKFGNLLSPIAVSTRYTYNSLLSLSNDGKGAYEAIIGSTNIIPIWKFLLMAIAHQIFLIVTTVSFLLMISTVTKKSIASLGIGFLAMLPLSLIPMIATAKDSFLSPFLKIIPIDKAFPYLFYSYGNFIDLFSGNLIPRFNTTIATPVFATIILLVWSVASFVISQIVFCKRDVLI